MNHVCDGDNGESPFSPYFKGVICASCEKRTYDPDEDGNCEECHKITCPACLEKAVEKHFQPFAGRKICPECIKYEKSYSY